MSEVSRRAFLNTGAGAAAAGAIIAVTGLHGTGSTESAEAEEADQAADAAAVAAVEGPVIVHIKDASTGEVSIFSGENEIAYRDPKLVARVARATGNNKV